MNAEEYKARIAASLVKSFERSVVEHPCVPLMHENVRDLTRLFGNIFYLWPPADGSLHSRKARIRWGHWLLQAARTTDGKAISHEDLSDIWSDLANGKLSISGPQSVIKPTHAAHARRLRDGHSYR